MYEKSIKWRNLMPRHFKKKTMRARARRIKRRKKSESRKK